MQRHSRRGYGCSTLKKEQPMSDGEVLYLALCGGAALAFILSLVYVTSVASGAPR
mgnify:FL=1